MDNLEKHIKENKKQLDSYEAPPMLWDKIEAELDKDEEQSESKNDSSFNWRPMLRIAAVFVVALGLGFAAAQFFGNGNSNTHLVLDEVTGETQPMTEFEVQYTSVIELKVNKIKESGDLTDEEADEILSVLDVLNEDYQSLNKELKTDINNDLVLEAMLENLQEQVTILDEIISKLEKHGSHEAPLI